MHDGGLHLLADLHAPVRALQVRVKQASSTQSAQQSTSPQGPIGPFGGGMVAMGAACWICWTSPFGTGDIVRNGESQEATRAT
jgi:hypothetical protein